MISPYIEGSKHADFTAAAEGHIMRDEDPKRLLNAAPGGSPAWNSKPIDWENSAPGVNYIPDSQAGHTTK